MRDVGKRVMSPCLFRLFDRVRLSRNKQNGNNTTPPQVGKGNGELKAVKEEAAEARKQADDLQEKVEGLEVRGKGLEEELEGVREALRLSQDASDETIDKLRWDGMR